MLKSASTVVGQVNFSDGTTQPTAAFTGFRNKIINGNFNINQRVVSGTVTLAAGVYGHDRWKAGAGGCTYTFSTSQGVTTITISAGTLVQVVESVNVLGGDYVLSWIGTAQGRIDSGSYGASGAVKATIVGGNNVTVEFGTGTISKVQIETGTTATQFENRQFDFELALCLRYFEKSFLYGTAPANGAYTYRSSGANANSSGGLWLSYHYCRFKVSKRATPTVTFYGDASNKFEYLNNGSWTAQTVTDNATGDATGVRNAEGMTIRVGTAGLVNSAIHVRGDWTAESEL